MQNSPTATRSSFVSPQGKPTPSRDLNVSNGKRYRLDDGDTDLFAASPLIPRISTRDSILSRTSTFSHTNNSNNPFSSRRVTSSPQEARRLSTMSFDTQGSVSSAKRLNVLSKSLDDFELFFKQQLRLSSHMKRGDMIELNKQCKQRITLLKQQINQVSEEDITSEDVMKEAQARITEVFKESENWKGQASNATLHLRELENKMNDMSASYQARLKTLVDELEQSKKLLERYENQELNDVDTERVNEKASKATREDAQKLLDLELETLKLKRDLQQHQAEKKELQSQVKEYSNQLIESEQKILECQATLEKAELQATQLDNALHSEIEELDRYKQELQQEKLASNNLQSKLKTAEESYQNQISINKQLKLDLHESELQSNAYAEKIEKLTAIDADKKALEIKLQSATNRIEYLAQDNHDRADELERAQHRIQVLENQLNENSFETKKLQHALNEKEGDLTGKLSQISSRYNETTSRIEQLSADIKAERAYVKQLKDYLDSERSEKAQFKNDLTAERALVKTLELELQSANHKHREAINGAEKEIRNLKHDVDLLSEENQKIQSELDLATAQQSDSVSKITSERDSLKRQTKEMTAKLNELSEVCDNAKNAQDQLQALLENERNKSNKLKSDLAEEQYAVIQLKENIDVLSDKKSSLQRQLDLATTHQSESISKITQDRNNLLGQVDSLVHQLEEANDNIKQMSVRFNQLQTAFDRETLKNEQLSKNLATQKDRIDEYSADFGKAVDDLKQVQRTLEASRLDKSELEKELERAKHHIQVLENQTNDFGKTVNDLKQVTCTMESLKLEKNELEKELDAMKQGTRQQSESHVQLTAERNSLKRRLVDLEHQLDILKTSESEHEQELLQEIQSKISDLHRYSEQLKQSKQRIEELNQDLADKSARLERVTSDLENARLQLQRSKMNEESIVQTKSNLTQRLEETAASLNQVVKEAAARDVEIARLESVRVDTRTQLENALAQHAKLEARIDQLEADLKQKNSVLSEFNEVSQELLEAADYAHKLEAVINRKEKQLTELEREAQSLIAERDEELKRIEHSTSQKIDQLQTRIESLRNKLASAEKELEEKILENSNLEKANTDVELLSKNLKQALSKCEADMARKTRDMDDLQYKYEHERDLVDVLTNQNAKLQEETKLMEHQETEIEARAKKIEKLEDTVNKILSDLASAMEKKRVTEERSKHFEEMASKIKAEAQDRIHDLEFKCTEAQRSIDDKERDLQNIRKLLREALRER